MDPATPKAIGKYEILCEIGRGGMGVVYRAHDRLMGRYVAIKTLTQGFNTDPGMLQRFYGEAEKMGMLRHPNIITVYDLGEQDGFPFIVMEYIEGDPLDRVIESPQSMPLLFKLRIMEQVCNALAYAHQNNVVHRDVKPANVIVRPDGVAKLLDFGIAKLDRKDFTDRNLTVTGGVIGTVPYMAPERLRGGTFDGRSDIFAVGVLLFQVLTGRRPFTGTEYVLVNQLLNDQHPPLSNFLTEYPKGLDSVLDRALAKDPLNRYQSADEITADLYPIIETLRHEYSAQLMAEAQHLVATGDFIAAQNVITRLLKADSRNTEARTFSKQINALVTQKAREAQAEENRRAAHDALRAKDFDQALRLFDDAVQLTPDNATLLAERDAAHTARQTNQQILECLQQADAAKRRGDYTAARAIVERALPLDPGNTRLRHFYESLVRQAEEVARLAALKGFIDSAREAFRSRNYTRVLDLVEQARPLDPDNLDCDDLRSSARVALEQQRRQRLLDEIEERLNSITSLAEAREVEGLIARAQERMPSDPILLRYKTQIASMIRDFEVRQKVEATIRQCLETLETAPLQALETVRALLTEIPGEPRLLEVEARINTHIAKMSAEEARAAILSEARDAMAQQRFTRAVTVLERCPPEFLTHEITGLLDYARTEARKEDRQQLVGRCHTEAQALLRAERYPEVVELLTPIATSTRDARIQTLLADAQRAIDRRAAEQSRALAQAKRYADSGCYEQTIASIDSAPAWISPSAQLQTLRTSAQTDWAREWARLEELGRAYAALQLGQLAAISLDHDPVQAPSPIAAVHKAFVARRMAEANHILSTQIKDLTTRSTTASSTAPPSQIERFRALLPFASEPVKSEWIAMADLHTNSNRMHRVFSRFGIRA